MGAHHAGQRRHGDQDPLVLGQPEELVHVVLDVEDVGDAGALEAEEEMRRFEEKMRRGEEKTRG